jgi:hypothetical protein
MSSQYFITHLQVVLESLTDRMKYYIPAVQTALAENPKFTQFTKSHGLNEPSEIVSYFNRFDPTGNKAKYVSWIIKTFIDTPLPDMPKVDDPPEDLRDGVRYVNALLQFDSLKSSTVYTDERDINKIKSLAELETIISNYELAERSKSVRQFDKQINTFISESFKNIYEDEMFIAYRIDLTGDNIKSVSVKTNKYTRYLPEELASNLRKSTNSGDKLFIDKAAYAIAKASRGKTKWCVASEVTAMGYFRSGPLYIIYRKDGEAGIPYILADATGSEINNIENKFLKILSPKTLLFMIRLLIASSQFIEPRLIASMKRVINISHNYLEPSLKSKFAALISKLP